LLPVMSSDAMNRPTPISLFSTPADEIYDLIRVSFRTSSGSEFHNVFFKATCSAINSVKTSSFVWIFFSK
jgi:hypothetical protein